MEKRLHLMVSAALMAAAFPVLAGPGNSQDGQNNLQQQRNDYEQMRDRISGADRLEKNHVVTDNAFLDAPVKKADASERHGREDDQENLQQKREKYERMRDRISGADRLKKNHVVSENAFLDVPVEKADAPEQRARKHGNQEGRQRAASVPASNPTDRLVK